MSNVSSSAESRLLTGVVALHQYREASFMNLLSPINEFIYVPGPFTWSLSIV